MKALLGLIQLILIFIDALFLWGHCLWLAIVNLVFLFVLCTTAAFFAGRDK